MNNEINITQDITIHNRKELTLTAVKKINSLNELVFDLDTAYGRILINGKNLEMVNLDIDKGLLMLNGVIDKIEFLEKTKQKKEASFIAKIFK